MNGSFMILNMEMVAMWLTLEMSTKRWVWRYIDIKKISTDPGYKMSRVRRYEDISFDISKLIKNLIVCNSAHPIICQKACTFWFRYFLTILNDDDDHVVNIYQQHQQVMIMMMMKRMITWWLFTGNTSRSQLTVGLASRACDLLRVVLWEDYYCCYYYH